MSEGIQVCEFKIENYEEVEEIWKLTGIYNQRDSKSRYEKMLYKYGDLFLVAKKGDRIVGSVYGFFPYMWGSPPSLGIGYIGHLAVLPETQGLGVGSKLMNEICRRLKQKGKFIVFLFAHPEEGRKRDLYRFYREKQGFSNISDMFYKWL